MDVPLLASRASQAPMAVEKPREGRMSCVPGRKAQLHPAMIDGGCEGFSALDFDRKRRQCRAHEQ
jgi:hypothetical protein